MEYFLVQKLSMLKSSQGLSTPWKFIDASLGRRVPPVTNHCFGIMCVCVFAYKHVTYC